MINIRKTYEVVIVQRRLCHYRVELFEKLKFRLAQNDINLKLLYGTGTDTELKKNDEAEIEWAEKLKANYYLNGKVCWQPYYSKIKRADLVIITQENKLLCNLFSLYGNRKYKLAFWGHGENLQAKNTILSSIKERLKRSTTNRVDWWFAYTKLSVDLVKKQGFPEHKITNLENAIENSILKKYCDEVTVNEITKLKASLGLEEGPVGLYLGSLFKEKRIDFLLQVGQEIVKVIPNFRLVIVGDGDQSSLVKKVQQVNNWIIYVGRKTGKDKALFLKLANILLNPGMVGLGILDSFIAGIPMVTTDCGIHSPEIAYLKHGQNGLMTENNVEAYVLEVLELLDDKNLLAKITSGALESSQKYTLDNMVERFNDGILKALNS